MKNSDSELSAVFLMVQRNIRRAMAVRRYKEVALAERIGRPQPWLNKRINGRVRMSVDDLELIAQALRIPTYSLFCEDASFALFDRRRSRDRRRTHWHEEPIEQALVVERGEGADVELVSESLTVRLQWAKECARRLDQLLSQAESRGQTPTPGGSVPRPRTRRRVVGGSDAD
jgi:transcriptional regulator with XRE-family HTH domain